MSEVFRQISISAINAELIAAIPVMCVDFNLILDSLFESEGSLNYPN